MARFTGKIFGFLAATPVAGFAAYEKAQGSIKPNPPVPDFDQVIGVLLSGTDLVASGSAILAAVTAGYAIYEMFKPDPATKRDVRKDGGKTRKGLEHVSGQIAAEGRASDAGHDLTHRLVSGELDERVATAVDADLMSEAQLARIYKKVAEKLGAEAAPATTKNIVEAAARSSAEVQQLLEAGKFVEAGLAQQRLAEAGDAKQAQLWRDTARIMVLTSITKAIAAYARAVDLAPEDFWTWIELSRLHRAAGSLPEARRTAEAALPHVGGDWDRMAAENTLGDIAMAEGQLPAARRHYQAGQIAAQALLDAAPDDLAHLREVSVSHNKLGDVAVAAGDLAAARGSYAAGLAIAERLAASDPGNAGWQRDVVVSHYKLAQLAEASGDIAAAIREFAAGEAILVALIARVGDHPGFARDLAEVRRDIARLRGV